MKKAIKKISILFILLCVISLHLIAQDEWSDSRPMQIADLDTRVVTLFKIDTAKESFVITTKILATGKTRSLERKLERLSASSIQLGGAQANIVNTEVLKDTSVLGGIRLSGNFKMNNARVATLPCSITLSYGKKDESIDLKYYIKIKDKGKDEENEQKAIEARRRTDSIAKEDERKAQEEAAEIKRKEEEDRKKTQKEKFQSLYNQFINIEKEQQTWAALQSSFNSLQQEANGITADQPNKVLDLKRRVKLKEAELSVLLTQIQRLKTVSSNLSTQISSTSYKEYHNIDQFDALLHNNNNVLKNMSSAETAMQQLQAKIKELLSRQIFDSKFLDSTAEGKIYNAFSPVMDELNIRFSKMDDSIGITMKFVESVSGKEKKGTYNCDSLWKLYDVYLAQEENVKKRVENSRLTYQKKLNEYKAVLKTGKVDAVEQQLADLDKYGESIDKRIKQLGAQLTGMNCKPVAKTKLPLFILGGVVALALLIIIVIRYRKKKAESQIKFLN